MRSSALVVAGAAVLAAVAQAAAQQAPDLTHDPALPTTRDPVVFTVYDFGCPPLPEGTTFVVEPGRVEIRPDFGTTCIQPQDWSLPVPVGRLAAGPYQAEALAGDQVFATDLLSVSPVAEVLALFADRFQVGVGWSIPGGRSGAGVAVRLSEQSGYFWFFDGRLPEVVVKLVDGRPVNGHFWVFITSLTTVEMTVTVVDLEEGVSRTYTQRAGENRNFLDTQAFPG